MIPDDPQFARSEILRIFNESQLYLCTGAAITTTGLLTAAFAILRRRRDPLLLWLTLLAVFYGLRLILGWQMVWSLGLRPPFFQRSVIALGFLLPIPALFLFRSLNLLDRSAKLVAAIVIPVELTIAVATFIVGPNAVLRNINNTVVLIALFFLVVSLLRNPSGSADTKLIRFGLFLFIACAVYDNLTALTGQFHNVEPFSFLVFLGCLGLVAIRRTQAREQQLSDLQKELDIAKRIQLSILPTSFPESGSFRVAARYLPMTAVAGDFYDFLLADEKAAGLLVADVSGHGVPAALIASMVKLAASAERAQATDPALLLKQMNQSLCGNTQNQYVTAAYVYLNAETREMRYSAAAHPPLLLLRDGKVSAVEENGLMLAAFEFATYTTLTGLLLPGDRIVLYTDGIVEAANDNNEGIWCGTTGIRDSEYVASLSR